MKREELQKLGLSEEQVNGVMKLHGQTTAEAEKLKETNESLTTERDSYKSQLDQRDHDLADLKKSAKSNDELSSQLTNLQKKYDDDTTKLTEQLDKTKLNAAVTASLAKTNARDADDLRRFLNDDELKLGEDGSLNGLDAQVEALQKSKPYLFAGKPDPHYDPAGGGKNSGADITTLLSNDEVNLTEALKERKGE